MTGPSRTRVLGKPTAGALVAALAAACGGTALARPAPGPEVSVMRIGLAEYTIATAAAALRPGTVRLAVTNAGAAQHDLRATQNGNRLGQTRDLRPGERTELVIEVAPGRGRVRLTCTLPGHDAAGMHTTVRVGP